MNIPHTILDFLFYLAPSLLVLATAWFFLRKFFDREYRLKLVETKLSTQKDLLPLRLQAYERLTLLLERISPNVLLISQHRHGMTVLEFQQELVDTVRAEFEHNFSQQIYVSSAIWTVVRNAKEDVVRIINGAASTLDPEAPSYQLSKKVFDSMLENEDFPTQRALNYLKNEVSQLF